MVSSNSSSISHVLPDESSGSALPVDNGLHSLPAAADAAAPVDFYQADSYLPGDSVGYLMRRILSFIALEVERELEPAGLTNAQWLPLFKLSLGQASTVAELARVCELDAGSMTRLLDRLEAKQLCRRVRSEEDRRVVNLELTEAGQAAAREIPGILSRVQNAHLAGFTHSEWLTLKVLLKRILETAQTLKTEADQHGQ